MLDHRVPGEADLAGDAQRLVDADPALEVHAGVELNRRHPVQVLQEVEVPVGPAELAVRHRLQADRLLLLDEGDDLAVFDLLERSIADFAACALVAGVLQRRRAQQAADHVGAKGRLGALHGNGCSCEWPEARSNGAVGPFDQAGNT